VKQYKIIIVIKNVLREHYNIIVYAIIKLFVFNSEMINETNVCHVLHFIYQKLKKKSEGNSERLNIEHCMNNYYLNVFIIGYKYIQIMKQYNMILL